MSPINLVCLCGSTRFLDDFHLANVELTKRGFSIVTISMALPKNDQGSEVEAALKEFLDLIHLNKVIRSDSVFVVGDGYIGRSTAREILWAEMQGKPVFMQRPGGSWDAMASMVRVGLSDQGVITKAYKVLGLRS